MSCISPITKILEWELIQRDREDYFICMGSGFYVQALVSFSILDKKHMVEWSKEAKNIWYSRNALKNHIKFS